LNPKALVFSETGAFRALWRLLFFSLASSAGLIVSDAILGPPIAALFRLAGIGDVSISTWMGLFGVLAGTAVCLHWIDKRSWRTVWLEREAARPSLLAFGFAIGALAIGLPIVVLIASHWLSEAAGSAGSWIGAAARVSLFLLPAALLEELTTRGYVLSVLVDWWGWKWAVAATSVVFGLLHLQNPGATAGSIALVTLAGFFLAAVLYATRSLYAAWMAHFAWNWTMAVVFHVAVSGLPFETPGYRFVGAGPAWATGGEWGPEGGALAGVGMLVGLAFLLIRAGNASKNAKQFERSTSADQTQVR
jgi:membrane protease YdiL (CAAX protease family)